MSDLQIVTRRDNGKVFIEMNSDSIYAWQQLADAAVAEIEDRLDAIYDKVCDGDAVEAAAFCAFEDHIECVSNAFQNFDKWILNEKAEMSFYDEEPK